MTEHGIQTEKADFFVHVCPQAGEIYVYRREAGLRAIESGDFRKVNGYQKGCDYATSEGYLVPPDAIAGCQSIPLPNYVSVKFLPDDPIEERGRKATTMALMAIGLGDLLLNGNHCSSARFIVDVTLQKKGIDIVTDEGFTVQVKCDYKGGRRPGGSGNLFLQVGEVNPFSKT